MRRTAWTTKTTRTRMAVSATASGVSRGSVTCTASTRSAPTASATPRPQRWRSRGHAARSQGPAARKRATATARSRKTTARRATTIGMKVRARGSSRRRGQTGPASRTASLHRRTSAAPGPYAVRPGILAGH
jgi:hypothetical protein